MILLPSMYDATLNTLGSEDTLEPLTSPGRSKLL